MSKIDSSGLEHGKRGDIIYVVLNGKQIKKDPYKPSNPRTPAQQKHRAKLAFANRLAAQLADAVNIGFACVEEKKDGLSPRNHFVKRNWDNGSLHWNEDNASWELCPQHLLLADGPRSIGCEITASVEEGMLRITCTDYSKGDNYALPDDRLVMAIYQTELSKCLVYEGPRRADADECTISLPHPLSRGQMHVYAWFRATKFHKSDGSHAIARPNQCSPSCFLGTFSCRIYRTISQKKIHLTQYLC